MNGGARIAVIAAGAISPFGVGVAPLWEGLIGGIAGIGPVERFEAAGLRSRLAALVPPFDPRDAIPASILRRLDAASRFAVPAAAQALAQAGAVPLDATGVILGTNSAGSVPVAEFLGAIAAAGPAAAPPILFPYTVANAPASQCALVHGLKGPNLTIVQKEGSSIGAIATASRMLASGAAEAFVAGGADDLSVHVYEVFDRLGVLSRDRCASGGGPEGSRPFDRTRNGLVLGEGACFLVLETEARARGRGQDPLAIIEGIGEGRAPVPPHRVPEDPRPMARAIARALAAAGAQERSLQAVFASANSSAGLDAVEALALHEVFGDAVPPVTSVRGAIGESGIAGAVSALAACLAIREGRLPGTAGLETVDPALRLDATRGARSMPISRVLVTAFASGGAAMAVVVGAP